MKFEYFVGKRLTKQKEKTYARPVVKIAIASTALSIAVMLIALSVLEGFKTEIKNKIAGFGSHIQVVSYGSYLGRDNETIQLSDREFKTISSLNDVKSIAPVYTRSGAIINDDFQALIVKGVNKNYDISFYKENLVEGKTIEFDKESKQEVLISKTVAEKLKLKTNDKIKIYFYIDNSYRAKNFYISGIYDTGLGDYDERFVICDMQVLKNIFSADEQSYTSYEIMLKNFDNLEYNAEIIYNNLDSDKGIATIDELEPNLFSWLNLLDSNVIMIIAVMMLVSIVTLSSVMLIMIFEKKTMIGVLKSFGTPNNSIIKIFLYKAGYVTLKGMLYGNILALTLEIIQKYSHIISLDQENYFLTSVPIAINPWAFLLTNLGVFVLCILCLIIPAKSITKISPTKNLKFE